MPNNTLPVDILIEKSFNILGGIALLKITQGLARNGNAEGFQSNVQLTYSKTTEVNNIFDTKTLSIVDEFLWEKQSIVDFREIQGHRASMQEQAIGDICKKYAGDKLVDYLFKLNEQVEDLEAKLEQAK